MKNFLCVIVAATLCRLCCADTLVLGPTPPPGNAGGPTETESTLPFALMPFGSSQTPRSMRYQQVYNSSLFVNVPTNMIWVTTLTFSFSVASITNEHGPNPWTVTNMQINLSTTPKGADNLSPTFSDNLGSDDAVVFGPASFSFPYAFVEHTTIPLDKPFPYNPALGNLLMDVRILTGSGPPFMQTPAPAFDAFNSSTDEVSRVYALDVAASVATETDTVGLLTLIQLSPIPSLSIYRSDFGSTTNYILVQWPTEPNGFILQHSSDVGPGAAWQAVDNPNAGIHIYYFPTETSGARDFFRLILPSNHETRSPTRLPESPRSAGSQTLK